RGLPHCGCRSTVIPYELHYQDIVPCNSGFRDTDTGLMGPFKVPEFLVDPCLDKLAFICCPHPEAGVALDIILHLPEVGCGDPVDLNRNEFITLGDALEDVGLLSGAHGTVEDRQVTCICKLVECLEGELIEDLASNTPVFNALKPLLGLHPSKVRVSPVHSPRLKGP